MSNNEDLKENRNNRFNIPKSENSNIIAEKLEQGKDENWSAEKLVSEIEKAISKAFNFDAVADKMTKRLLANFQDMDKSIEKTEDKPTEEKPTEEKPQVVNIKEPEKIEPKKSGIFGFKT